MQRSHWIKEAAACLQLLRTVEVIHSDANPKSFLLGAQISLKVAGLGGSFLAGSNTLWWQNPRSTKWMFR